MATLAGSWKDACWRAEGELAEYKESIVPALKLDVERLQKANHDLVAQLNDARCELMITRNFVHEHGLEWALMHRLRLMDGESPF